MSGSAPRAGSQGATAAPDPTPIGVDVGEKRLVTAAPAGADPADAFVVTGGHVRESAATLADACRTLQSAPIDSAPGEAVLVAAYWDRIRAQLHDAAARLVRFAREYGQPVLVLEAIGRSPTPLWAWRTRETDLGTWLLPHLQAVIVERAGEAGVPIGWVPVEGTTVECHECDERLTVTGEYVVCTTSRCPVGTVGRDRSAALSIAAAF